MNDKIPNMDYDADEVIDSFKSKFKWPDKDDVEVVVKPKNLPKKILLSLLTTVIVGAGAYYMMIPALNFKSTDFYTFIFLLIAVFVGSFFLFIGGNKRAESSAYFKKKSVVPIVLVVVILAVMLVGWLVGCTFFRAKDYSNLVTVQESDFSEDFSDIKYDQVPRLDATTSKVLADQQLGSLSEYKSQYVVSSESTQINYQGHPARVAYLEYADVFKWFNNTKNGLPAYMLIDLVSQKVTAVNCIDKFGEGIKYSPTELFNEKLIRHLRFQYPTAIMDTPNFEIDDEGHPYWITPVLDKTIGLFGGTDVKGAIITDALNGESTYLDIDAVRNDKTYNWIDVVYSESLLIQQYNYHGKLSQGFWNSIIFQNDVNVASQGRGNIAMDDDVWVYTGVTSSESDASNFGFIFCNQRTKELRYYKNGGAIESSAQQSAEDAVQNYGYRAIFPILLDIEEQPTYFMSLYGDSYTVKGYALVNLDDKTVVGTGLLDVEKSDAGALNAAVENYIAALKAKNIVDASADADDYKVDSDEDTIIDENGEDTAKLNTVSGEITDIMTSVNDGNTVYYLQINGKYYYIAVTDCMDVLLMKKGDTVTVTFDKDSDTFVQAKSIKK
ncbi:CvpA family protein [Eubacterium sp.]|uniref:CvpA family protein n=1 Tax=Eubacterium sp. TaxID=142586 RepID=UPI002A812494|nr:CvpA family protein [Eubacterium sp.]MDY3811855.1 CvpA family protein [Eubacterium sp.]